MKLNEVPQDKSSLADKNMRELCYAVDKDGNYATKLSDGWDVKTLALNKTLELIEERIQGFKEQYLNGTLSPIPYYMELNKMDLLILSGYMGKWRWTLKRHFKPKVFKKLPLEILEKYAQTFNITVEQLKNIPAE
jgi:hypothetical protein